MEAKKEKKEQPAETKEKKEEKFDFKGEMKKLWGAIVRFVKPYKNLDQKPIMNFVQPFLKKNINMVYLVGMLLIVVLAIFHILSLSGLGATFSGLAGLLFVFLLFRLVCELIASGK